MYIHLLSVYALSYYCLFTVCDMCVHRVRSTYVQYVRSIFMVQWFVVDHVRMYYTRIAPLGV